MSPAKLALRRHLSQERLSSTHLTSSDRSAIDPRQSSNYDSRFVASGSGLFGTKTIGDLVSVEIERTLEISNQSVVNPSVDIRPETAYSPISRPASAEGDAGLSTLAHVASYAPTSSGAASTSTPTTSSRSSVLFTPVTQQPQRYFDPFLTILLRDLSKSTFRMLQMSYLHSSDIHRFSCRERILSLITSLTFRIIRLSRSHSPIQRRHLYIRLKAHRTETCYLLKGSQHRCMLEY